MPVVTALVLIALSIAAFAEGRSRADRRWVIFGFGTLVSTMTVSIGAGVQTRAGGDIGVNLGAAFLTAILAVDVVGLPLAIGRRLQLGLHSREWEFDRRLHALNRAARRSVENPETRRERGPRDLPGMAGRIRSVPAPDADWAAIRDGWAEVWERYAELLTSPAPTATREDLASLERELDERTEQLRSRYRSAAEEITGSRG